MPLALAIIISILLAVGKVTAATPWLADLAWVWVWAPVWGLVAVGVLIWVLFFGGFMAFVAILNRKFR